MARMRTVRTGSSPARRRKVWTNTDVDITLTGPTAVDLLASYRSQPGAVGAGLTVMGVIFQHRVTEAAEVTAQSAIDLGIIVDRSPAADVPNPSDDEFADWMWNSRYYVDIGGEHWENPFAVELQSFRECLAQAHEEIRNGEDAHRPHGLQPRS